MSVTKLKGERLVLICMQQWWYQNGGSVTGQDDEKINIII